MQRCRLHHNSFVGCPKGHASRSLNRRGTDNKNKIQKLKKYVIWVVRQNTKGELRNAAPCNACCNALKKLGFRKVIYSDDNGIMNVIDLRRYVNNHVSNSQVVTSQYSRSV
jgi:hypothetical protein